MKHKLRRQFTEEYREQQNSMKRIGLISDTHGTFDQTLKTFLKANVYQITVRKSLLSDAQRALLDQEPLPMKLWDPLA